MRLVRRPAFQKEIRTNFMFKAFGLLVLTFSLLIFLGGLAGAVMNFVFPPKELSCTFADEEFKKAEEAVRRLEKAKGTDDEPVAQAEAKRALDSSEGWSDSCARAKESHRFYGLIFSGVGVVGFVGVLLGAVLSIIAFRRKKLA